MLEIQTLRSKNFGLVTPAAMNDVPRVVNPASTDCMSGPFFRLPRSNL